MSASVTAFLIADASRARLFLKEPRARAWKLVLERIHPEGRAHGKETTTDRPGRFAIDHRHGFQAQMEPLVSPHERAARGFARRLATALKRELDAHAFDRLVLAAPPHFLGLLRAQLAPQVAQRVCLALDKDYTQLEARELERRVDELL